MTPASNARNTHVPLRSRQAVRGVRRFWPKLGTFWLMLCLVGSATQLYAEGTWEFSPYRVRVWLLVEASPLIPERLERDTRDLVAARALATMGVGWQTTVEAAPEYLQSRAHRGLDSLTFPELFPEGGKLPQCDKLFVVVVQWRDGSYQSTVQEWDVPTRHSTIPITQHTAHLAALPTLIWHGMFESFRPLVKIEKVEGRDLTARLRSGGLITDETSPLLVTPGSLLHPVIRRNLKSGEPTPGGIVNPPWTYLLINSREGTLLTCKLHTAYASPVPAKGGQRLERLALVVQRRFSHTNVVVQTRKEAPPRATRGLRRTTPVHRPLADYEIFAKLPEQSDTKFLGLTDWRGSFRVERDDTPLRLLYVRNGGQFLARLPLVVGEREEVSVEVYDDDPRLIVETRIRALQSRLMDTEARRELLAKRIRLHIENKKFAEAEALLEQVRQLPQRSQLVRELEDTKRNAPAAQGTTKLRMEKLFVDANKLLVKFLNPDLIAILQKEISTAKYQHQSTPATKQPAAPSPAPPVEPVPAAVDSPEKSPPVPLPATAP